MAKEFKRILPYSPPPTPDEIHPVKKERPRKSATPSSSFEAAPADTESFTLYADGAKGYKWWTIWVDGHSVTTKWGPAGILLGTNTTPYSTLGQARKVMYKTVEQKRAKGYRDEP